MISFTAINHFCNQSYRYGLNFQLTTNSLSFIGSKHPDTYLGLMQAIVQSNPKLEGNIHFDKYELVKMGSKTKNRFLYSYVQVYTDQTFYDQNMSVYDYCKENWLLNHLNTHDFANFFHSFCDELNLNDYKQTKLKELSPGQQTIIGCALAFFNKKKYLILETDIHQYLPSDLKKILAFIKLLNEKQITVIWFTELNHECIQPYCHINLDDPQYDHMVHQIIINDQTYLASKYVLNVNKWFQMTNTCLRQSHWWLCLIIEVVGFILFLTSLFFANKPVSLFQQSFGFIKTDMDSLLLGVSILILLLIITIFFIWYLYSHNKKYLLYLSFSGVSRNLLNGLICFIILAFAFGVILPSYIILLITYSSFNFLDQVKWISSIYFPISFLLFDLICCVMCANLLKSNLLALNKKKLTWRKNKTQKENNHYGKKI